jgi:hypothetical protein
MTDPNHTAIAVVFGLALLILIGWLSGAISRQVADRMNQWLQRFGQRIGSLSSIGALLLFLLALVWLVLFGVTVVATFGGVLALQADPGSGGLGLGAVLIGLLGAPFLIWNTVIKQTTLNFQKEGHITDRISKAVEQLGAEKTVKVLGKDAKGDDITIEESKPNIEVRIGGILSLERIAQDSTRYDRGRDHVRVMEILCAYVRENAPAKNLDPTPTPFHTKKPRLDVQKALNSIKRRSEQQRRIEVIAHYRLDLREVDLDGCDLSNGHFCGAILFRTRFEAANLSHTDFTGSQLQGCLLNHAWFLGTVLRGTNMNSAIYSVRSNGPISLANLDGVFIEGADMSALVISNQTADSFFGSRDTKLNSGQNNHKTMGLDAADSLYLEEIASDPSLSSVILDDNARKFLHWNPYDANDFAAPVFRTKYKKRKGLVGWPFDD